MEKTDAGTSVGVDDPYAHVDRCDHLTDGGQCRFAAESAERDPAFAEDRRREDLRCPVAGDANEPGPTGRWEWRDCPHFRSRAPEGERTCARCGLAEIRLAHDEGQPLLERHHLSYADGTEAGHEITVALCRWCHAKVHGSWARIDDEVSPDAEAVAERECRRGREQSELSFRSASERFDGDRDQE
jgi:hypothetical protein